jgi:hypothetical protein
LAIDEELEWDWFGGFQQAVDESGELVAAEF